MNDFIFRDDDAAFKKLLNTVEHFPKTRNCIQIAVSLGAVIAGGAAISLLEGSKEGKYRPARDIDLWSARDIDLWFPNKQMIDVFMLTLKIVENVSIKKSFGGHAYDIDVREYGPILQVVAFRVGDPVEIISEFDFVNCAVALNEKGFWYHKDVPSLLESKKLVIQKDTSAFLPSRVYKYLCKGFHTLDESVQIRLFRELDALADKGIEIAKKFQPNTNKPLQDYDADYKPMLAAAKKAASVLEQFLTFTKHNSKPRNGKNEILEVFKSDQKEILIKKLNEIIELKQIASDLRAKTFNLPYGYARNGAEGGDPDVDALLNLV